MIRALVPLAFALSGCAVAAVGPAANVVTQATRAAAKSTVARVADERLPGIPVTPVADCVIDNASAGEILTMARFSTGALDPRAVDVVLAVAQREDTVRCLVELGIPRVVGAVQGAGR